MYDLINNCLDELLKICNFGKLLNHFYYFIFIGYNMHYHLKFRVVELFSSFKRLRKGAIYNYYIFFMKKGYN